MPSYREALKHAAVRLQAAGVPQAYENARDLMLYAVGMSMTQFLLDEDQQMQPEDAARYEMLVDRRCSRIPLQHLTGMECFYGLDFLVNEHVLIPRPETELLAQEAIRCCRKLQKAADAQERTCHQIHSAGTAWGGPDLNILDLCTGSGCVLITILRELNDAELSCSPDEAKSCIGKPDRLKVHGTGTDISQEALALARVNADRMGIDADWVRSDMFSQVSGKYDLIVSNPPYIRTADLASLEPEVRDHDPRIALDGGEDGLRFYRILAQEAPDYLKQGGALILEIGSDQADDVCRLLEDEGFRFVSTGQDLNGMDRIVKAYR